MFVLWLGIKNVTVFLFLLKSILKVKKVTRLTACNITVRSRGPPHLFYQNVSVRGCKRARATRKLISVGAKFLITVVKSKCEIVDCI